MAAILVPIYYIRIQYNCWFNQNCLNSSTVQILPVMLSLVLDLGNVVFKDETAGLGPSSVRVDITAPTKCDTLAADNAECYYL